MTRPRDRHGRGLRGPLAPPVVPLGRSPAVRFESAVLGAIDRLRPRWEAQLRGIDVAVELIPPETDGEIPLGRAIPASGQRPARIVFYRRPIEVRCADDEMTAEVVFDILVEQLAELLGIDPEVIDPE